jgi:hypothetical protein
MIAAGFVWLTPWPALKLEAPHRDLQIFLLAGQSNMAGRGVIEAQDRVPVPGVFSLNREMKWVPAVDPLHFENPKIDGVGLGRSFARVLLYEHPSYEIGLIPAAVGATNLDQWKRGGALYADAVRRTWEALKSGTLRGILWHQGEGDALTAKDASSYIERWSAFIRDLRADLGAPELPVVVGELCESLYHRPGGRSRFARVVNEQLALLPFNVAHCAFVSSAGLRDKGDSVHFDSPSQRELGRRYAYAFLALDPTWAPVH